MASLDGARAHAQQEGIWQQPWAASQAIREGLGHLPGIQLLSAGAAGMLHSNLQLHQPVIQQLLIQEYQGSGDECVSHCSTAACNASM